MTPTSGTKISMFEKVGWMRLLIRTSTFIPEFRNLCRARLLLYITYILLRCTHLGCDWLSMRSTVAGVTFMNGFAPYAMQAPPLKRRTRKRFTEIDYNFHSSIDSALAT